MNLSLKRLARLFLFLPVPLGLWVYHLRFISVSNTSSSSLPQVWYASLGIAAILQSLIFLPVARTRPRSLSTVLIPTVLLLASLFLVLSINLNSTEGNFLTKYIFEASRWSPAALAWLLVLISLLAVIGYSGSLLTRNLPTLRDLREMKLISWAGLALSGVIVSSAITLTTRGGSVELLVFGTLLILPGLLTWKLADEWWRNTPVMLGLLTTVSASFFLLVALTSVVPNRSDLRAGVVCSVISIRLVSLSALWTASLRFALHYFPRPQRLRKAGLLDWRGILFGSGLVLACILRIAAEWPFLSVDSGWPIFWLLCVAAIALYRKPAKAWQQKPELAYLLAAVAIIATVMAFILLVLFTLFLASLSPSEPDSIQSIYRIFFPISLVLTLGCGLVALLPGFQSLIREEFPGTGSQLRRDWAAIALLSVPSVLWMYWLHKVDTVIYVILTGCFILLAAYLVAPWLSGVSDWGWLAGMAALIAILGFVAIITREQWAPFSGSYAWSGFLLALFLHVLVSVSFGLLMHWASVFRCVLSFLLLIALGFVFASHGWDVNGTTPSISLGLTWDIENTAQAMAYVWLALFAAGWLLAPLLPSRIETWRFFALSGVLLLLVTPFLLPISFQESELVIYRRPLPAWASLYISKKLLHTGFPAALVWSWGVLLFAGLIRSGPALLARSRTPKPEMVSVGVLFLGVFLALSSSHGLSPEALVYRLVNGTWGAVALPEALDGEVSQLLSDDRGTVWVAVGDSGVTRFDGQWRTYQSQEREERGLSPGKVKRIYEDQEGHIWVVTEQGLTEFDPKVDEPIQIYDLQDLKLPRDTSINTIYQDSQGTRWVGTSKGLLRLQDQEIVWPRSRGTEVQQIGEDPAGRLWFGTNDTLYVSSLLTDHQALQYDEWEKKYDGGRIFTWKNSQDEVYYYIPGTQQSGNVYQINNKNNLKISRIFEFILLDKHEYYDFFNLNSGDRIWASGSGLELGRGEGGPLVFSDDGETWHPISKLGLREIRSVSAIEEHNGTLWFAGQAQTGTDGALRYVIAKYSPQVKPNSFEEMYDLDSGLATGEVKELAVDSGSNVWALIEQQSYTPNSVLWFVLPVLLLAGLGYREYDRQSLTQAQRLSRKLRATPERTVALLYSQLQNGRQGDDVLRHVADERSLMVSAGCSKLAGALVMLAPDQPVASSETLGTVARQLASASEMPHAAELGGFYGFLASASAAKTSAEIAAWPLKEIRGAEAALLISQTREPIMLPPFVGGQCVTVLESLSEAADILGKSIQVDNSQDKVVYLADALSAAERAARAAIVLSPPEGRILQAIAQQWAEIIRAELNTLSGRAELRLELLTRQVRRAAQVTLALRVQNAGRATAEKVTVSLVPDGLALAGETQLTLTQLSSGGSAPVEFAVTPLNGGTARVACRVSWDDRVSEGNVIHFADVVRFYESTEAFQPIPNPYIVGPPVKSAKIFHGREDIFRFIADNLSGAVQDRTFVLHGQRRTGKTSILYQLAGGRLGANFVPVLIDMQELVLDFNTTGDFLNEVAYQLARAARKADIPIDAPPLERFASAPTRAFSRFLDALEDMLGERHVLVMFDEFELIDSKIAEDKLDPNLLGYFRSLMQHRERLVFLFIGTHRLEEMSHDYWSILFNIALYRRVSFLKEAEAVRLIRQPVAGKLDVDELAVEKIMRLTSGHPYFIQLICWSLVNYCNAQQRNYATINDVNATVQEILMSGQAHFAYIWQQAPPSQRLALAGVAHTLQPGKMWARPVEILATLAASGDTQTERSTLTKSLDHLAQQQVLECATEGVLRYRFQIEVLRLWVKQSKSVALLLERKS
ncbi:MAG: CARDB domain-containing protein [Ardenticatenaceae bacterium]